MRVWTAVMGITAMAFVGAATPALADYKILSDDRFEARRVIAVELLERAPAVQLAGIADAVKARDSKAYQRTVVNFYLPSMNLGDGSWATVTYSPERLTTINGMTRQEELAFFKKVRNDKRDRIGSWIASSPAIAGEVTIFQRDGRKFVEWTLRSGLKSTDEAFESRTWRGRRFDIRTGSNTHFLINSSNDLEIRDAKGLIATGERIEPNKNARRLTALTRSRSRLGAQLPPRSRHPPDHPAPRKKASAHTNRPKQRRFQKSHLRPPASSCRARLNPTTARQRKNCKTGQVSKAKRPHPKQDAQAAPKDAHSQRRLHGQLHALKKNHKQKASSPQQRQPPPPQAPARLEP